MTEGSGVPDRPRSPSDGDWVGKVIHSIADNNFDRICRDRIVDEIVGRSGMEPLEANDLIEEALLAEVIVPADENCVCLNPMAFGRSHWPYRGQKFE